MFYVYFLRSTKNNKVYCGMTNKQPRQRLLEHNQGSNEWSRKYRPFHVVYYESYCCEQDARAREKFYKTGFGRIIRNAIIKAVSAIG